MIPAQPKVKVPELERTFMRKLAKPPMPLVNIGRENLLAKSRKSLPRAVISPIGV
jgi:hypothetical protein